MPNHLTPEEIGEAYGLNAHEVLRLCMETGVPVYHGRIDRGLFEVARAAANGETPVEPVAGNEGS